MYFQIVLKERKFLYDITLHYYINVIIQKTNNLQPPILTEPWALGCFA